MAKLKRILHADDEPDIREIVKMSLELFGDYSIKSCASGKELLKEVKTFNPQLILLDVMMPEMDGRMVFEELKKDNQTANIPVVFMTAKVQSHEIDSYLKLGGAGVVIKPFVPETLSEQLVRIWESI